MVMRNKTGNEGFRIVQRGMNKGQRVPAKGFAYVRGGHGRVRAVPVLPKRKAK